MARMKLNMDDLSDDAKALAGCWFAKMGPKSDGLTLHLKELKPAPRTQAALDEMVARGVLSKTPFNQYGGEVYKPLLDCFEAFRWFMANAEREDINFRLMVPVNDAEEA